MTKNSITVMCVSTVHHDAMRVALDLTVANTPDVASVKIFSDRPISGLDTVIPLRADFGYRDYNEFVLQGLWPYVDTSHVLLIQPDGMAINAQAWHDDFYQYDYIGCCTENPNVFNGGFSLRSRRLLEALRDPSITPITYLDPQGRIRHIKEDAIITNLYRRYLEDIHQLRFCDARTAGRFSHEFDDPGQATFGFHGLHNFLRYLPRDQAHDLILGMSQDSDRRQIYLDLLSDHDHMDTARSLERFRHRMLHHINTPQGAQYS